MIKTNELMLGNFVEFFEGDGYKEIIQVELLSDKYIHCGGVKIEPKEINPIPITEEMLDKMGDKIRNGLKCGDVIIRFSKGKATVRPIVGFGEITGLRYLHELQNAYFMLTKKHLEVKL